MRAPAPRGDAVALSGSQTAGILPNTEVNGTALDIDVPTGCIAIVTGMMDLSASGNTVTGYLLVDAVVSGPSVSTVAAHQMFAVTQKVGPGKHRIALGMHGSSAAGGINSPSLSYTIVQKDGKR